MAGTDDSVFFMIYLLTGTKGISVFKGEIHNEQK